jgi:hypothetical protein
VHELELPAVLEGGYGIVHREAATFDAGHLGLALEVGRHLYLVDRVGGLLDGSDDGTGLDLVADLDGRHEVPLLGMVETWGRDPSFDEISHLLLQDRKGPLNAVVYALEQSGAKLYH